MSQGFLARRGRGGGGGGGGGGAPPPPPPVSAPDACSSEGAITFNTAHADRDI